MPFTTRIPVRRLLATLALSAAPVATMAAVVVWSSGSASADTARAHEPIGTVEQVSAPNSRTVEFTGWVADPDAPTANVLVEGVVDGGVRVQAHTSIARPWIAQHYRVGATSGFTLDVPVSSGWHDVCLVARSIGDGFNRVVTCTFTPLGRTLTSSQWAQHGPQGAITWANAGPGYFHVAGHATDPDYRNRRLYVSVYLDGRLAASSATDHVDGWTPPAGAGQNSRFDVGLHGVAAGAHLVCVRITDVGPGDDTSLGCQASDTRGRGTGTVPRPAVNDKVVSEALKHIGQNYVWGAAGPTTFDCSGLVTYTYAKFGISTPHQSALQFHLARVISADRAVPGDLVFYHDSGGDVYHVGIYLSPGRTVAAIDTAEGVDYQTIWNPASATYGSFTHS